MVTCLVCKNNQSNKSPWKTCASIHRCPQCGDFITQDAIEPTIEDEYRYLVSGYIREHQDKVNPIYLTREIVNTASKAAPPSTDEQVIKILSWMKKISPTGKSLPQGIGQYPELVAISYAKDMNEVGSLMEYLEEENLVKKTPSYTYQITVKGLKFIEGKKRDVNSDYCFCAMSFNEELKFIHDEFIKPAARLAGYNSIRIDEDPHNEGIMDRIVKSICQSKFVIADLTENNGGVYYEAGWAKGVGKEVIFTCRYDSTPHFDVRHLHILKWKRQNFETEIEKLQKIIEGSVGRGNYKAENANRKS